MFSRPQVRIDMRLTDEHILKTINELLPSGHGCLPTRQIAELCKCHPDTVRHSVRRLQAARRLEMDGGSGRKPVTYKVVKEA